MRVLICFAALALVGCGSVSVVSSAPRNVVIGSPAHLSSERLSAAEAECSKYGKHAVLAVVLSNTRSSFNCVD